MAAQWIAALAVLMVSVNLVSTQDGPTDICASNPCRYDGTCTQSGQFDYDCACASGFTGSDCEVVYGDVCLSDPCQNGGTCTIDAQNQYECACAPGFTGGACEEHVAGVCLSNPCQNGGTCLGVDDQGSLSCQCLGLFTASRCEEHIREGELLANETGCCLSAPCRNGGTCSENSDTGFSCECGVGFSGPTCEERGDFCTSGPCLHGGTCNEDSDTCSCNENDFTGSNCEVFTQGVCLSDPCIYGDCVETDGGNSYQCACLNSFTGSRCEKIGDSCAFGALGGGGRTQGWCGLTGLLLAGLLTALAARM